MQKADDLTREQIIEQNIGLVHACAKRFKNKGVEYEDLFQTGCVGLIKAFDGFDTERGVRFSTYAVPVILGEIKRIFRDGGTIKVSRHLKELSIKVARIKESLTDDLGNEPTVCEIAHILNCDEQQIIEALCASRPIVSLTAEDENERQLELPVESEEDEITDMISLQSAIYDLNADERLIISLRYFRHNTQSQVAERLGTTQVQISRMEKRILEKLKVMIL